MKALLLALGMVLAASPAWAQTAGFQTYNRADDELCRQEMEQAVADLGIPASDVKSLNIVERVVGGSRNKRIVGWTGWMRPVDVKGYLVIEVNTGCSITHIYTRGEYSLPGVEHY